jgi:hypothetical protein
MNGPDHPLNGRLGGYCWGPVPWVRWAAGYSPTNLDMARFSPASNGWRTKYSILDMVPRLLTKGKTTNLKELNPDMIHTGLCPTSIVMSG